MRGIARALTARGVCHNEYADPRRNRSDLNYPTNRENHANRLSHTLGVDHSGYPTAKTSICNTVANLFEYVILGCVQIRVRH